MKSMRLPISVLALALVSMFLVSCQGDKDSAKDAARTELENTGADAVATSANTVQTPAADAVVPVGPTTAIEFADTKHDYGMIEQGEKVSHIFTFKNTGNEPLVLSNVKPSCGCTTPKWTKEPIAPGAQGEIQVEFDSKGKSGKQTKTVTITANTDPATTILTITGDIQVPPSS
jgi:hypothetical protein